MGTEKGNFDPTYLTHAARKNLRNIFLNAEAAMTGANFAVASTGDIVVCTNEGNADMGTSCPTLNIAAFGLEKIVPDMESLGVFTRLLARSATGQPVTTYTSHYRKPSGYAARRPSGSTSPTGTARRMRSSWLGWSRKLHRPRNSLSASTSLSLALTWVLEC